MKKLLLTALPLLLTASVPAVDLPAKPAQVVGEAVADAVEHVMPGVVVIRTRDTRMRLARDGFYGNWYQIPEHLAGQGSGFVIDEAGYVLTNNHVVESADEIEVVMEDGTVYPAELLGRHQETDLAVLKIARNPDKPLVCVKPADSDALRIGQFVIAIGSPFSLHSTVTLGIVSQTGRTFAPMPFVDYIQTDAAINRGNSGGPLVDIEGRMVGVNTFIQTAGPSEGFIGIGFAVPSNLAMKVARSIIEYGTARLPWLGIVMQKSDEGIEVMQIMRDAPADKAGLEVGDRILQIGDRTVKRTIDVKRALLHYEVDSQVPLQVRRGEETLQVDVVLEALPSFLDPQY